MKKNVLLVVLMFGFVAGYTGTAAANDLNVNISTPDTISPNGEVDVNILLNSQNVTRGFSILVNIPEMWSISRWDVNGLANPDKVTYQPAPDYLWHDGYTAHSWTFESPPAYSENNPIQANTDVFLNISLVIYRDPNSQLLYDWFITESEDFGSLTIAGNITMAGHIYNLQSSWNMVSLPVTPISGANVNDIFGGNITTVFRWTGTRYGQIGLGDVLVPKEAYWVLSNSGYDQFVLGAPLTDTNHTLSAGWNMVGPVSGGVSVDSLSNVTTVFGWTGTRYEQITGTQELEQTKGYWMLADQDTVIQI